MRDAGVLVYLNNCWRCALCGLVPVMFVYYDIRVWSSGGQRSSTVLAGRDRHVIDSSIVVVDLDPDSDPP